MAATMPSKSSGFETDFFFQFFAAVSVCHCQKKPQKYSTFAGTGGGGLRPNFLNCWLLSLF
jgi:hypothetical protein